MFQFYTNFWKKGAASLFLVVSSLLLRGQISLNNPSFEGIPSDATVPSGWFECSPYTTPDILPGFWGVYDDPKEGDTFLGLITRSDGSFESIGQRFSQLLEADKCYQFSFFANQSSFYAGFNDHVVLKIWLGQSKCSRDQLIYKTEIEPDDDWRDIFVDFVPDSPMEYLIIEATHLDSNASGRGNVLLDHLSAIRPCIRP